MVRTDERDDHTNEWDTNVNVTTNRDIRLIFNISFIIDLKHAVVD